MPPIQSSLFLGPLVLHVAGCRAQRLAAMHGAILMVASLLVVVGGGCKRSDPSEASITDGADSALTAVDAALEPETLAQESQAASPSDSRHGRSMETRSADSKTSTARPQVPDLGDADALGDALFGPPPIDSSAAIPTPEVSTPSVPTPKLGVLQLEAALPVPRLVDFLKAVDLEMQNVATGRTPLATHADANAEMIRLAKLKLQAASQLIEKTTAETTDHVIGLRGQLQALSHLAALGDLPAAERLERLATEQASSPIASLALDSQLVLVGLAMERLRNGVTQDSSELLDLIANIARMPQTPDVSALMVMGQAHAVLQQYGDEAAAEKVRQTIVDLFADHPNENVAAMAIGLAGSPKFAAVDQVLRRFGRGEAVAADSWRDTVTSLLAESADVTTVQYLAGAALQFEASGNDTLSDATFAAIAESENVIGRAADELAVAVEARRARRLAIGQPFEFSGPTVDGRPLSLASYEGQVVLMPFWAIAIPESLAILQSLAAIRQQHAEKVEIVGMNLDAADAPAADFLEQSPVPFRSFQGPTSANGDNQIAREYGVVSLPFVVILDRRGHVAAINLSGRGLNEQVARILEQ